jgi:fibronectin-binding autotransporter adhesin
MIVKAKAGNGIAGARSGRSKLLSSACGAALMLACVFPSVARADSYTVNNEADLTAALAAAAANADPAATIILGSSFQVSNTSFTLPNKPVTIDTQGFVLTGPAGSPVNIIGPATTLNLAGTISGASGGGGYGQGLTLNAGSGTVNSTATITGGAAQGASQAPSFGVTLLGATTFVNGGTIRGGDAVSFALSPSGSSQGAGLAILNGATLINNGLIQGSNSQADGAGVGVFARTQTSNLSIVNTGTIRGGSDVNGAATGNFAIGGYGGNTATITNSGTLEGGNGAAAISDYGQRWALTLINSGIIVPGVGQTDAIRLNGDASSILTLELRAGSDIRGNVIARAGAAFSQTLQLGGSVDANFDMSKVGAAAQYRNFTRFVKSGASSWTLTGNAAGMPTTPWELQQGTLLFDKNTAAGQIFSSIISSGTLNFQQDSNVSVGSISGGSVIQSGLGTTTLTAVAGYGYSGLTITAGKLSVDTEAKLGIGSVRIDGGTLQWSGAGNIARTIDWGANGGGFEVTGGSLILLQPLVGGGALTKSGAGTLTLAGNNSYTGGTTISAGALNIGSGGTTGSVLGDIVDNSTLQFNRSNDYTYAGAITGTGGVAKAGAGTTTLTGQNNYGSGTSLSSGQLLIGAGGRTTSGGATSITAIAAATPVLGVDGAGSAFTTASINASGSTNRSLAINVTNGGLLRTMSGGLSLRTLQTTSSSTNTAQLTIDGVGSLADLAGGLTVANVATNTGSLSISGGGALRTGDVSAVGFTTGNTRVLPTVTITGAGSNWTSTNSLAMSNGGFILDQGGMARFSSATFGSAAAGATVTVSGANSSLATTTGNLVIGSGTGTASLTLRDGGAVNVAGSLVLADAGTATGILSIGGAEGGAAAGSGSFIAPTLNLGSATSRLNFNHTGTDYVFSAVILGSGAINQVAGDTNLTGTSTLFAGTANVSGGTLRVNGTLGGGASAVNVLSGGRLGGSGTIGGSVTVANGGTLAPGNSPGTLTIAGDLNLASGSLLDYEFGQSSVVGGPLNDLTVVGGNLTLDGTIDVTVTSGGNFDTGVYRILSYGGTLTDNGLTLGTLPAGSVVGVQTSIAGQVNLVNSAGATVNFWDGAGPKLNGFVNGGNGVWQNSTGNDNWTDITGTFNNAYNDGAFAIFMATPGTVTVDNGPGAVTASGMQFASNGYVITGSDIGLIGPQSIIRVGDGTAAGAGYSATIASSLTGASQLVKTDLGTLILSGANSYSGGTAINAGTLQIGDGGTTGSITGDIANNGALVVKRSGSITLDGAISGTGTLTQLGAGTLTLTGDATHSGGTTITAGSLQIGDGGATGTLAGDVVNNGGLQFNRSGTLALGGLISGTGLVRQAGTGTTILTGANSYGGITEVATGTLLVNGNQSAATATTHVAAAATLGGTGMIGGSVDMSAGGTLAAGSNGAGTLTINGDLTLGSGSHLAFELGQAGTVGGALNDLVNVGGTLTLDGTLDVAQSASGTFGPGIYRLFNYGGALFNNGLFVGTQPAGTEAFVQTSVANQVNLVNIGGLNLNFWDGAVGPKFDGIINGGSGVWQTHLGNDNWTDANGAINAGYSDGAVAIFAGNAGTVTVSNTLGAVTASGMQFATGGYVITGDPLTLMGAQATIRVGDGSAAGAGYIATIASELTGTSQLVKVDLGTLILSGVNSYTGGTRIDGGTLAIGNGGATGSITGDIVNNGALVVNRSGALTLDGAISGAGTLTKLGSGLLILSGTNSYSGGTLVGGGTVRVSSDANLGDLTGTLSLQGGTLQAATSFTSSRGVLLGSSNSNTIDTQGFDVTLTGAIGDGPNNSAGNFVNKLGSGTLTLSGANTYNNRTIIVGGTLALAGTGTIGTGNLIVGGGTVFDISQTSTGARIIQLNSGPAGNIALGSKTLTLGFGNSFSDWSGTITDGGIGGGTGGRVVIAAPNGAVRFFEANSYTGGTTVAAGTLALDFDGSLYANGAVAVNAGAVFAISGLNGTGTTIGDLSGAGTMSLGGKSLTFGTANSTSFSGTISGAGGALVKNGSGTFTLSGTNSYTGMTTVNAGTLLVNGNQSAATGLTSVVSGATLGGSGTIGGDVVVADGGTLAPGNSPGTLTINGNLTLAGASTLAYELGAANAVGSPLNDLVNVGGNLTLDGTLNVTISPSGSFDIGLYRIANYGGALTDNGLTIGAMPAGADLFVQTSVPGQVNLVNTGSAVLNFWDGNTGPKFNGLIDGGGGVWRAMGTDNWTDATGAVNSAFDNGAFAIFAGTAGSVTIDDSQGAVSASGLQFASAGGYLIQGEALTLTGPQSVIRVGDGTAAGSGYAATIASAIAGNTQLVKSDIGRLVLTGVNNYTGGTAINGGTVQIAGDTNLGAASGGLSFNGGTLNTTGSMSSGRGIALSGQGVFSTDTGTTLTLTGNITGAGNLGKAGTGTLVLAGTGSHTGSTTVAQGTLIVNGDFGAATGLVTINGGATLGGTGIIGGDVSLGGTLAPGAGGTGTLTINGDLLIAQGATLAYAFGQANIAGGTLNDLVKVGGDLTLDGTINVTVPTGGAFDAGIYRVFDYGGAFTNNGLTLGALPAGSNVTVQTSVVGQVNLVNSAGLTLNFWDGAAGPKNNGVINGGTGVWQNGAASDNWTDASGALNAAYSDSAFAVFGGTGGTVTVDNGAGPVTASGMQFATGGYTITGGEVALTGPLTTIRVGDGSAAGASYGATINSALTGNTQLVKTDAGTLVLGGANTYTGGTLINGGTVQIASDANLGAAPSGVTLDSGTLATTANLTSARSFTVAGPGTFSTASSTTLTLTGALWGNGALTKAGAGTLVVTGNGSGYAGAVTVASGTFDVRGTIGGGATVAAGARLEGIGQLGSVVNNGTVAPGGEALGTLTLTGSYASGGGTLEIAATLGGDASATDRLVVGGGTSGTTEVILTNRGGLGAQTVEGIKIVDVAGASDGVFTLRGDYQFEGAPAVVAGAYGYRLYKNGISTVADGDWYLRSALLSGGGPQIPLYQPGVPVYEAYGQTMLALSEVGTMQERIGNRQWAPASDGKSFGIWGRMESKRMRPNATLSTSLADVNIDNWRLELGADHVISERSDGATLVLGVLGGYGEASASIGSPFGGGSIKIKGYSAGATLSWFGPQGFYVDSRAQVTWFDSKLKSTVLGTLADGNNGMGQAYSVEMGKRTPIDGMLSVTPQIQMVYSTVGFDRFTDPNDAVVSSKLGDSLKTRWGISLDRQDARSHLYAVGSFFYEWLDGTVADVSGTPITRTNDRLWGELGFGGSVTLDDRLVLYGEASADTALNDFGKSYSLKGVAGLRLTF